MLRSEVMSLIAKIKVHRKFFGIIDGKDNTRAIEDEWYRILKDYSYDDVDNSLEKWLMNEKNIGQEPNAYYLTKYLLTIDEKENSRNTVIYCDVCMKPLIVFVKDRTIVNRIQADEHLRRCRSVRYLKQVYSKYIGREIDTETENELKNMSDKKFDETYYLILKKVYNKMQDESDKTLLKKVLDTRGVTI
ncbi:MAG TPA: hypothetical protein DCE23_04275 [Firmicutes bacterium]|nr:hypothetical protein [Bacillota bacterium]